MRGSSYNNSNPPPSPFERAAGRRGPPSLLTPSPHPDNNYLGGGGGDKARIPTAPTVEGQFDSGEDEQEDEEEEEMVTMDIADAGDEGGDSIVTTTTNNHMTFPTATGESPMATEPTIPQSPTNNNSTPPASNVEMMMMNASRPQQQQHDTAPAHGGYSRRENNTAITQDLMPTTMTHNSQQDNPGSNDDSSSLGKQRPAVHTVMEEMDATTTTTQRHAVTMSPGSMASVVSHSSSTTSSSRESFASGGRGAPALLTTPQHHSVPYNMLQQQHPHEPSFADIPEHGSLAPMPVPATVGQTLPSTTPRNSVPSSNSTVGSNLSSISGHSHDGIAHHPPEATTVTDSTTQSTRPQQPTPRQQQQQTHPRLPHFKLTGAPKSELYALYGKDPYRKVLGPADYITWNDGGPPHNMRFTSVFVCPVTGETFASGGYLAEGMHYEWKDGFCWYRSKKMAEHGAAARAHDCLSLRAARTPGQPYTYVGNDEPYRKERRRVLSSHTGIPPARFRQIARAQRRAPQFDSDEELEHDLFT